MVGGRVEVAVVGREGGGGVGGRDDGGAEGAGRGGRGGGCGRAGELGSAIVSWWRGVVDRDWVDAAAAAGAAGRFGLGGRVD